MPTEKNLAAKLRTTEIAEQLYQKALNAVWWWNRRDEPWGSTHPNMPAHSWYPNIAAEMEASQYSACTVRNHARISGELLAAVLVDYERLELGERYALSRLWGCPLEYLSAGTLQTVDPCTNKGKFRRRQLHDLMADAAGAEDFQKHLAEKTLADLEAGKPVTYARWRWAMGILERAITLSKPRAIRTLERAG